MQICLTWCRVYENRTPVILSVVLRMNFIADSDCEMGTDVHPEPVFHIAQLNSKLLTQEAEATCLRLSPVHVVLLKRRSAASVASLRALLSNGETVCELISAV